ncbi:MAG: hypothetical protein HYY24_00660 [Verrucomicrobia bacterium]|nr:hypothetical protein [Verrucomicrobiota bacterium]
MTGTLEYQRLIVAYHGCDAAVAERVLLGRAELQPSDNPYDWLGRGIYFWEHGPRRALEWAEELKRREPRKVRRPAVLGAYINLGFCFDLLDRRYTQALSKAYPAFVAFYRQRNQTLPQNRPPAGIREHTLRFLDCAVLNWFLDGAARATRGVAFQTVRGVFVEGAPAFPGSGIRAKSHIQVAVRDPRCILGYFRPQHPLD